MEGTTMRKTRLSRSARAFGVLVALSAIAAAPLVRPSDAVSAAAATTTTTAPIKIATYNVETTLTPQQALSDIQKLASTGVDVIALQEMGSRERRDFIRAQFIDCSTCQWAAYMPLSGAKASENILFRRSRFALEDQGSRQVSEQTYVGPEGAGPSTLKAKYISYVRLYDKTSGQHVWVLNNHAVPSVQAKDGGPNYKLPVRLELYKEHMEGLKTFLTELTGTGSPVFVTGDFNVNYRTDKKVQASIFPYSELGSVNTWASYRSLGEPSTGTHVLPNGVDTRLIDYVFNLRSVGVTPRSQSVLLGYASDHRPFVARYDVALSPDLLPTATAPDAATDLLATAGDKQATVSWTPPADNGAALSGYTVTAIPDGTSITVPGTATNAVMGGLTNGRKYTFSVDATNKEGAGPASAASNVVVPATVPRKMARPAVEVHPRRAIVTWTKPRTGGSPILGYRVRVNDRVVTTGPDVYRLVLSRRGIYRVRVAAFNAIGGSTPSDAVRFRIRR
jgi:endonuclease/exonuclease/phosphatase (EEP) superfamily protein YafD